MLKCLSLFFKANSFNIKKWGSGFSSAGLPVGLQIAGKWGEEDKILQIGSAFEKIHPFWKKRPPVFESPQDSNFSYEYSPLDEIGDNPLATKLKSIINGKIGKITCSEVTIKS